jgi:hypothetical protein
MHFIIGLFLNDTKACEDFFFVQADTVNLYQFVNAYKQSPGKKHKQKNIFSPALSVIKISMWFRLCMAIQRSKWRGKHAGGELIMGGCIPDKKRTSYCRKDKYYF